MSICRGFLSAMRVTVGPEIAQKETTAAVLGDASTGYTVELHDGTQLEVGRAHCKYCARVEALSQLADEAEAKS